VIGRMLAGEFLRIETFQQELSCAPCRLPGPIVPIGLASRAGLLKRESSPNSFR